MKHQRLAEPKVSGAHPIFSLRDNTGLCPQTVHRAIRWRDLKNRNDDAWRDPTYLYRYYSEDDRLLYVGITFDFLGRDAQHEGKDWRWDAAYATLELFPSRDMAEVAELTAISAEDPEINVLRRRPYAYQRDRDSWFFEAQGDRLIGCRPTRLEIDDVPINSEYWRSMIVGITVYDCPFRRLPLPA